jgi:hypothetical protein
MEDRLRMFENGVLSHTTGISASIFPARVLHLQETGDYLGWRPTYVISHTKFFTPQEVSQEAINLLAPEIFF